MSTRLISRFVAGWALLIGLGGILTLNILLIKPFLFGLFLAGGLILSIIFLYQPIWGIGLFLILRPIIDNKGEEIGLKITENLSLNINALLGILVTLLLSIFLLKNHSFWKKIPFRKTWLLFISWNVASLLYSLNIGATLHEIIRLCSLFFLFSSIFILNSHSQQIENFYSFFLVSAIVPFFMGIWQIISQTGLGGTPGLDGRLFGTFSHPNTFAGFILIVITILWLKTFQEKKSIKKKNWLILLAISVFLLIETFSRGAWLSFLLFLFILSLIRSPKIIFIALSLFSLIFIFSEDFRLRLQDIYHPSINSSIYWRVQQWKKGIASWEKHAYIGWGAGTETLVFEKQYGFYAGNPYTHNDFLRAGIENGLVGFLLYGLLMGNVFIFLIKRIKNHPEKESGLELAIFSAITFFSLSSNLFRATAIQWFLWSFLAVNLTPRTLIDSWLLKPKNDPLLNQKKS